MKIRYIFIVIILGYLILFFSSWLFEIVVLDNTARDMQLIVKTAAQMALQQTQATDDYFVSGGGYRDATGNISGNDYSLSLTNSTDDTYIKRNIFNVYAGSTDISDVYNKVYSKADLSDFVNGADDNFVNKSVKNPTRVTDICFLGAYFDNLNSRNWVAIPSLSQLGLNSFNSEAQSKLSNFKNVGDGSVASITSSYKNGLVNSYRLQKAEKTAIANGETYTYYNTPLSLGITYMNKDILGANFIQNVDMLMRSKYDRISKGSGVCATSYYASLVDQTSLKDYSPINNGAFTFLRGKDLVDDGSCKLYQGIPPRITYYLVDLYNQEGVNSQQNQMIRRVVGPRLITQLTSGSGDIVSGRVLKELNKNSISNYKGLTGVSGDNTLFDHKLCVVAKVDFYAMVMVPYRSPFLREMVARVENGVVGRRTLFNAFKGSGKSFDDYKGIEGNYVSIPSSEGDSLDYPYPDYIYDYIPDNFLDKGSIYTYTTYFAVLP